MKNNYTRFFTAVFGLAVLAVTAKGQAQDQLTVNIPYEFVVAGKTLPAGTYRINRVRDQDVRQLVISSFENRAAAIVLPIQVADKADYRQYGVTFQQVGDQHLLSKIETADHIFTIPVPTPAGTEVATKGHSNPSAGASASSGSN